MNKAILLAALILFTLFTVGCRGKHNRTTVQNEEPDTIARPAPSAPAGLASSLKMGDPAASQQLGKGFYGLEGGAWRWTAREFTATLHPPAGAAQRGGTVTLSISIPPVVIDKLGSVTLTASIAGTKLKPATYSKAASFTYSADVPADLLGKDAVNVDFSLDKALPPGTTDTRELGVVATAVGLEAK
jgi:hypothetical protein